MLSSSFRGLKMRMAAADDDDGDDWVAAAASRRCECAYKAIVRSLTVGNVAVGEPPISSPLLPHSQF